MLGLHHPFCIHFYCKDSRMTPVNELNERSSSTTFDVEKDVRFIDISVIYVRRSKDGSHNFLSSSCQPNPHFCNTWTRQLVAHSSSTWSPLNVVWLSPKSEVSVTIAYPSRCSRVHVWVLWLPHKQRSVLSDRTLGCPQDGLCSLCLADR